MADSKAQHNLPTYQTSLGPHFEAGNPNELYRPAATKRRSVFCRLLHTILLASALMGLLCFATHKRSWITVEDTFNVLSSDDWEYDVPSNVDLGDCIPASTWSVDEDDEGDLETARTSMDIPLSADNIMLLSRGWLSYGIVKLTSSKSQSEGTVTFEIAAQYHRKDIRDLAKACFISRPGNEQGVGIFTPTWRSGGDRPHGRDNSLRFITKVVFPESASPVNGFETDVPNTAHSVGDLKSKVNFESISLKGSNALILVDSLVAVRGSVHTSNAAIRGSFNASKSLSLTTTNSPIEVKVGLFSDSTNPHLEAVTTNGKIGAMLSLTSSAKEGGKFDILAKTTNSPLFVGFSEAPLESTLSLEASTTNSPAHVRLDSTYEGEFDVATSRWFATKVNFLSGADPSGKERRRGTSMREVSKGHVAGSTSWRQDGRKDIPSGKVDVHTTNGAVTLDIVGV